MRSIAILVVASATACSSIELVPVDASTDAPSFEQNDASTDGGRAGDGSSSLVFVNGLVNGNATDMTGAAIVLSDVRLCVRDAFASTYPSTYAMPDSAPMPFTSYPGVERGRGIDFGRAPAAIVLDVYLAADLASDTTWSTGRTAFQCDNMGCTSSSLPCRRHVTLPQTAILPGVNVVALVDDPANNGVKLVSTSFADLTYAGTEGSLWGTVVDFSGWHSDKEVGAYYGNFVDGAGVDSTITQPLSKPPLQPKDIADPIASYETLGIRFDAWSGGQPFDRFGQSLDSIAFVSNAALTPPAFYGVRENFVFALVGDPNDPTSVLASGGRDPTFDGRGLHVIAVPYATPHL